VWLNGMEVTQFTYFQQVGGIDCKPITGEITYGLERLAMYLQGVDNVYDLTWTEGLTYGDVYHQNEVEQSTYNFEHSDVDFLLGAFGAHERQAKHLMDEQLALPAYEQVLKAAHTFNLLDARGAISVTERAGYIGPHPQPRAQRRAELSRQPRAARLPDGAEGLGRRGHRALDNEGGMTPMDATKRNLLVELFVEELPPKALKKLGEARSPRAWRNALIRCPIEAADPRLDQLREPAAAGRPLCPASPSGDRSHGGSQADAGGVGLDAEASRRRRCSRSWPRWAPTRRRAGAEARRWTARPRRCSSTASPRARRWPRAAEGARRGDRQAADPEGHALPARRRLDQRRLRAPAHGWSRCTAATWCRERARPAGRPHDAGPPLRGRSADRRLRDADSYADSCATKAP
jgi:hypothetical protein